MEPTDVNNLSSVISVDQLRSPIVKHKNIIDGTVCGHSRGLRMVF